MKAERIHKWGDTLRSFLALWFVLVFLLLAMPAVAQRYYHSSPQDSAKRDALKKWRPAIYTGTAIVYAGSMTALYYAWYDQYSTGKFRFFNDGNEWLGMDKAGHILTSYYESFAGYELLKLTGMEESKAKWWGGATGLLMQTPLEIMDGFSSGWGFSWPDMLANTTGSALWLAQQHYLETQALTLKFSYAPSRYAMYNPGLLGSNAAEQILKDYNGQVYWLNLNPNLLGLSKSIPKYLELSVGYSGDGMLRGTQADQTAYQQQTGYDAVRRRELYLSLDINLRQIKTESKGLRAVLYAISWIKVPLPGVRWREGEGIGLLPLAY